MVSVRARQVDRVRRGFLPLPPTVEISGPERRGSWHIEPGAYSMIAPSSSPSRVRGFPSRPPRPRGGTSPRVGSPASARHRRPTVVSSDPLLTFDRDFGGTKDDRDHEAEAEGGQGDVPHVAKAGDHGNVADRSAVGDRVDDLVGPATVPSTMPTAPPPQRPFLEPPGGALNTMTGNVCRIQMPPRSWKLMAFLPVARQHEHERERLDHEGGDLGDLVASSACVPAA